MKTLLVVSTSPLMAVLMAAGLFLTLWGLPDASAAVQPYLAE